MGTRLRERRLALGMTLEEAASRLETTIDYLQSWEEGGRLRLEVKLPLIVAFLGEDPLPAASTPTEELCLARLRLGLSREALARRLGIRAQVLWRWESGRNKPRERLQEVRIIEAFLEKARRDLQRSE